MTWILTVHSGGGSMVEAADPVWACSFGTDEKTAREWENMIGEIIARHSDPQVRQEWWPVLFEVHTVVRQDIPKASAAQVAAMEQQLGRPLKATEIAHDLQLLVDRLAEGEEIEILPEPTKPPTDDEQAAAIASITGTNPNV